MSPANKIERNLSESVLSSILDGMTEMVCRFEPDGHIRYVNAAFCRLFSKRRDELIGQRYAPALYGEDFERVHGELAGLSPRRPTATTRACVVLPSGQRRSIAWNNRALFDENGQVLEIQACGTDVTDSDAVQTALQASNRRFRFLADAAAILASSLDYETTLGHVARLAVPFLADGCTVSLVDGEGKFRRLTVAHVDAELEQVLRHHSQLGKAWGSSYRLREVAERLRSGRAVLVPHVDERELAAMRLSQDELERARLLQVCSYMLVPMAARGRTLGAIAFVASAAHSTRHYTDNDLALARELADRAAIAVDNARLYAQLQEHDRHKDEYLAMLSHELRNPMSAVIMSLEVLQSEKAGEKERQRAVDVARRQTAHQKRLIEDLLDASRLTRGKISLQKEPVKVCKLVRHCAELAQSAFNARNVALTLHPLIEGLTVAADPARLQQVIGNLLDNARKYTKPGGLVNISVRPEGTDARIDVTDTGVGISPEQQEQIFELFVQVPSAGACASGLGIGLTIARQLVELHAGKLELSSEPGRGSCFTVRLPLLEEVPNSEAEASQADIGSLSVLVVDDDQDSADMLKTLMQAGGHDARAVYGGEEALLVYPEFRPRLIFIDLSMPDLDGYETARRLRGMQRDDRLFLVALTGYAQAKDVKAALAAGFDRHLAKPVDMRTLQEVLAEAAASNQTANSR